MNQHKFLRFFMPPNFLYLFKEALLVHWKPKANITTENHEKDFYKCVLDTECQAFFPVVWTGSPHPLNRKGVLLLPHLGPWGPGGDTLACEGSQFRKRDKHSGTLCTSILYSLYSTALEFHLQFASVFGIGFFIFLISSILNLLRYYSYTVRSEGQQVAV